MQLNDLQLPKVLMLAALAILVGIGVLQLDGARRERTQSLAVTAPASSATTAPVAAPAGQLVASTAPATPAPATTPVARTRGGVSCETPHRVVEVPSSTTIRQVPGGPAIGTLPSSSKYLGQSMTAWVQAVSSNGRWGRIAMPWTKPVTRTGWVPIVGLAGGSTTTMLVEDLSERRLHVYRGCRELFSASTAIGRPGSASPKGRFWVTDRVAVPGAQQGSFGSYAFGLSTVQPNLPAGWTGGDQMAIHGTGAPGSIGQAASAGCLRVSEQTLARLKPLLRSGTPVVITG
jgi:lipoprotein-anchoring transpeptidase ErfK/SrfK